MYKPGGTIANALDRIHKSQYVLPAIQREFVWKPQQIERLFDSLMQGYPFGTFLFWRVEPSTSSQFKFYDFVLNYHQRDAAHCPDLPTVHNQTVTAVLDGQQRLTALNIGLRGSMAMKEPYKWWNSPDAFPRKTLRLNLLGSTSPDEDGVRYDFRFLDDEHAAQSDDELWFKVPEILGMDAGPEMLAWLTRHELAGDDLNRAFKTLHGLHSVVHDKPLINYYEEEGQDIERVLNIFIRLNSGGTVLSYSDLLLSVAVAQWKQLDARAEIHRVVDEINKIGTGFALSQDFVLKAGLMLADIKSVGFKVENFTAENMALLEERRARVQKAESASEEYQKQLNLLQARLEESQQAHGQLEDQLHEKNLREEELETEKAQAARQKREVESIYESERAAILKEKEEQTVREEEMKGTIQRLKESLAQREAKTSDGSKEVPQSRKLRDYDLPKNCR